MQLTVRDAARYLNVAEETVYRWINDGAIPSTRINEQYRLTSTTVPPSMADLMLDRIAKTDTLTPPYTSNHPGSSDKRVWNMPQGANFLFLDGRVRWYSTGSEDVNTTGAWIWSGQILFHNGQPGYGTAAYPVNVQD